MRYYLLAGGIPDNKMSINDLSEFVVSKYGNDWDFVRPAIESNNIGFITQATNFPVPVSYFYSIVMDSSFDALIDRKPGRRTVDKVLKLFKTSETQDEAIMLEHGKYNVNFVYRVFSPEFLRSLNLTGEYAVDLKTALRLERLGFVLKESPYRYKFMINGKKNYSPLCCLPESLHNTYINDLSQTVINTCTVSDCLNMICGMEGFRYIFQSYMEGGLLVYKIIVQYDNSIETRHVSSSYRECMLLAINKIINFIEGINHEENRE